MSVKKAAVVSLIFVAAITGVLFLALRPDSSDTDNENTTLSDTIAIDGDTSIVWVETENKIYRHGNYSIKAKWYNKSELDVIYGTHFTLEIKDGEDWISVSGGGKEGIGFILRPNSVRWHEYNIDRCLYILQPGDYRIKAVYSISQDSGDNGWEHYYAYACFTVGDTNTERDMTVLNPDLIEYTNKQYGFSVQLPISWAGYSVLTEAVSSREKAVPVYWDIDQEYVLLKIRHPSWSEETPYQDIAVVIFSGGNIREAERDNGVELPENLPCKFNNSYTLIQDIYSLDPSLPGYGEVSDIFERSIKPPFNGGFDGY